jgi:hypothetical protein
MVNLVLGQDAATFESTRSASPIASVLLSA